jgi:hypothetical protein
MKIEIIVAFISFIGVLISITISYFISKRSLKVEKEKINRQINQDYTIPLLQKRIEVYPEIYFKLSDFASITYERTPTIEELELLAIELRQLAAKYAIFLSAQTENAFHNFRKFLNDVIKKIKIEKKLRKTSRDYIQRIEIGLKRDLGIFIVEFDDIKGTIIKESYRGIKNVLDFNKLKNSKNER